MTDSSDLEALKTKLENSLRDSLNVTGGEEPTLDELFSDDFMRENTDFTDFGDFLKSSPVEPNESAPVSELLDSEFGHYVRKHTEFGSWQAMRQQAEVDWMRDHLA